MRPSVAADRGYLENRVGTEKLLDLLWGHSYVFACHRRNIAGLRNAAEAGNVPLDATTRATLVAADVDVANT